MKDKAIFAIIFIISIVVIGGFLFYFQTTCPTDQKRELTIRESANAVVESLKNKDMDELSKFVHPDKGVRFSPYTYVDINKDKVYNKQQIQDALNDTNTYIWGVYDGSGQPISKTFKGYFDEFVYDQDYINAEEVIHNNIISRGNTINNVPEIYPDSQHIEYYFSGFDPEYGGMDWRSLRLVFEKKEELWYLVGIVHDEWTI